MVNIDHLLGALRQSDPQRMAVIDAMLFRAGYVRQGHVVPGWEDQVRSLLMDSFPDMRHIFVQHAQNTNKNIQDSSTGHRASDR
jgi:hypothetical protein